MKRSAIILLHLITCLSSIAQPTDKMNDYYLKQSAACGGMDSVLGRKGSWKKTEDADAFPDKTFPRSQYKFLYARMDSIYGLLKEAITDLHGFEPRWYRGIRGDPYTPNGPVPYKFTTMFFEYYCNTNSKKMFLGDETSTTVYVFINTLNWFLYKADTLDINDDGKIRTVYQLPPKDGQLKGMTVYKLKGSGFYDERAIIIGRNGKIPWRSITQKQYLTGLKNQFEKKLAQSRKGSGSERDYTEKLKHIHDYLAIAEEQTLQQTAIIDPKSGIWGFKGKFGEEDTGGFRLVLFAGSDTYFDKNLPRYVPQLIEVYWSYNPYIVSQQVKNQFEKNFPFDKLKALIDK
jgi:hypothetical protein